MTGVRAMALHTLPAGKSGLLPANLGGPLARLEAYSIRAVQDAATLRDLAASIAAWDQHPSPTVKDRQDRTRLRIATAAAGLHLKADAVLDAIEDPDTAEAWWVDLWIRAGERNRARVKALADRAAALHGRKVPDAIKAPPSLVDVDVLPGLAAALRDDWWERLGPPGTTRPAKPFAQRLGEVSPAMAAACKAADIPLSIPARLHLVQRTALAVIDHALVGL